MDLKSFVAGSFLMLDGGMGTMLMQAGMPAGSLPELMNLNHPEVVTAVHKKYVDAGTDMVIANGSRPQLLYDIAAGKSVGTRFLGRK